MMNKYSNQTTNEDSIENGKINHLIKEGYEIILNDYSQIEKLCNILIKNIPVKYKDSFSNLFNQIELMKKHFKSYINSINITINKFINNENLELNNTLNPSIKDSYKKIGDEFNKIEIITKEVIESKKKIKERRKNRIKLLEKRLQSYCDEIDNFNFSKINNIYELNIKDNENVSNYILKNKNIEHYKLMDYNDDYFDNHKNNSKLNNKNSSTESDSNNDNLLIKELIKMNYNNKEEVFELIQSFEQKKKETIKKNINN